MSNIYHWKGENQVSSFSATMNWYHFTQHMLLMELIPMSRVVFIVVPLATKPLTAIPVLVNIIIPWWWVSWMRPYHGGCDCWCCCHEHCLSCQLPKSLCQNFICWIAKGSEDSTLCPHSLLLPSHDKPHQFGDQYGLWGTTYPPPCWKWVTPTPKIVWKFLDHSSDIFNFSEYQLLQHWLQLKLTLVIWD